MLEHLVHFLGQLLEAMLIKAADTEHQLDRLDCPHSFCGWCRLPWWRCSVGSILEAVLFSAHSKLFGWGCWILHEICLCTDQIKRYINEKESVLTWYKRLWEQLVHHKLWYSNSLWSHDIIGLLVDSLRPNVFHIFLNEFRSQRNQDAEEEVAMNAFRMLHGPVVWYVFKEARQLTCLRPDPWYA